ncbi:MAG: phosphopyruvate hydratase [Candidatus Aenigmarchaeota archaeon]|nr:phosphopyruvate hydratase [Candidatus Aenigmarchaeota archaeon]
MEDVIKSIWAQKILDSRGNWTIEVFVNGVSGIAPSGASTGTFEAKIIPADKAVDIVNSLLRKKLLKKKLSQVSVDNLLEEIDGTADFSKIGGNTATAVSFAAHNAMLYGRLPSKKVFPYPLGNVFGGGAHGGATSIQEFLAVPIKAKTFPDAVGINAELHHRLREVFKKKVGFVGINDEGALTADVNDLKALDIITDVAKDVGCRIGLDMAASEFFDGTRYNYDSLKQKLKPSDQLDFVIDIIKTYKLVYVEDPLNEDDFENTAELTKKVGSKTLIAGDDIFVTNAERLQIGIDAGAGNSLIIKPNQVGSITRAKKTVNLALKNDYLPVVSHRSAETTDHTISALSLEWGSPLFKAGVVDMRISKLNSMITAWNRCKSPGMAKLRFK